RKAHPILRQIRFLHARERLIDGIEDLFWWRADGEHMQDDDWNTPELRFLCAEMRTASGTPKYAVREEAILLAFNAGEALDITLPEAPKGKHWVLHLDTSDPERSPAPADTPTQAMAAESVIAMVLETRRD
ncbi:MAG: glycogen debranching protein GlgX, partial [Rhodobacterales bacterium]